MNWFTKKIISDKSVELKNKYINQDGGCEHVEKDPSLAYAVFYENDSFGVVESYVSCKKCWDESEEDDGNEEVLCFDCKSIKRKKDTTEWKWYDFYAPQGDEPLIVCKDCISEEIHKRRVSQDHRNYMEEMERVENHDY